MRGDFGEIAPPYAVFLLCEDDDRAPFRRFVGKRRELCCIRQFLFAYTSDGLELGCLAVAEGDRAGLVEEKRVYVARGFDGASGHGKHVEADEPVHAGNADRG